MSEQSANFETLREAVFTLKAVYDAWEEQECTMQLGGKVVDCLSDGLEKAIQDVCVAASKPSSQWSDEHWHTVEAADNFANAYREWKRAWEANELVRPTGSGEMWDTYSRLMTAEMWSPRDRKVPRETIDDLLKQNCGPHQVANIYEFELPDGALDLARAQREMRNPGSEFDSKTFEGRDYKAESRRLAAYMADRRVDLLDAFTEAGEPVTAYSDAPEPIEDLVQTAGMSLRQLKLMKPSMTEAEILEVAKKLNVTLADTLNPLGKPAGAADRLAAQEQVQQQADAEYDRLNAMAEQSRTESDLVTRIVALRDAGETPGTISMILEREDINKAPSTIGKILAQYDRGEPVTA